MRSCTDLQTRENKWKAQTKNIVEERETIEGSEMDQVNDLKIELNHTTVKYCNSQCWHVIGKSSLEGSYIILFCYYFN